MTYAGDDSEFVWGLSPSYMDGRVLERVHQRVSTENPLRSKAAGGDYNRRTIPRLDR